MADTVVSFPDAEQTRVDDYIARKYNYQERVADPTPQDPRRTKLNPETRDQFVRRKYGEIIVADISDFAVADEVRKAQNNKPVFTPTVTRPPKP